MMKTNVLLCLMVLVLSACSKKDEVICIPMDRGKLNVKIIPRYNGESVMSTALNPIRVFIAYEATTTRGNDPEKYDRIVEAHPDENWILCKHLNCGIYYFQVVREVPAEGKIYSGGQKLVTEQKDGQIELTVDLN
jgi:hypothetical protein